MPGTALPALVAAVIIVALAGTHTAVAAPPPPTEPGDEPAPAASNPCDPGYLFEFPRDADEPFAEPHMVSPAVGATSVPRNVEIVLGGFLADLDVVPPFLVVKLRDESGAEIPSTRNGSLVRPVAPLAARTRYELSVELADPDSCVGCGFDQGYPFTTGDALDTTPPSWSGTPLVQALVFSPQERQCGMVSFGSTHVLLGALPGLSSDVARFSVAMKVRDGAATRVRDSVVRQQVHHLFLPGSEPLALGDDVVIAVSAVDVAGNAGPPVSVRVRARPFDDLRALPFIELDHQQCSLPGGVQPALASVMPTNARFVVELPVESVPLAVVGAAGALPLHPVEHLPFGQVLEPAEELPAGAVLDLVTLPCAHCACIGCDVAAPVRFTVGDGPDEQPPEAPVVLAIEEDLEPPMAREDCYPDRSALIAFLARGADVGPAGLATPLEHLRYDASLRLDGQLAVDIGRALPALVRDDGSVAVRLDTAPYGRLLGERFELRLVATDLAGNRAETTYLHEPGSTGCSSTRVPPGSVPVGALALLVGLALALSRRRP